MRNTRAVPRLLINRAVFKRRGCMQTRDNMQQFVGLCRTSAVSAGYRFDFPEPRFRSIHCVPLCALQIPLNFYLEHRESIARVEVVSNVCCMQRILEIGTGATRLDTPLWTGVGALRLKTSIIIVPGKEAPIRPLLVLFKFPLFQHPGFHSYATF